MDVEVVDVDPGLQLVIINTTTTNNISLTTAARLSGFCCVDGLGAFTISTTVMPRLAAVADEVFAAVDGDTGSFAAPNVPLVD